MTADKFEMNYAQLNSLKPKGRGAQKSNDSEKSNSIGMELIV